MIKIKVFVAELIQENCYVVHDESKECVIIDCGLYSQEERDSIVKYIDENKLKPVHLIATHGHLDHHFGDDTIYNTYGLLPEVHHEDEYLMTSLSNQAEFFFGVKLQDEFPTVGKYLNEEDIISYGSHKFSILETPGHTPGSIVFYDQEEHVAFTGDTLFKQSVGRTDLKGGSMFQMIQSLRMLSQLPDITTVLPGHGDQTTIGAELASNPYLDR